MDKSKAIRQLCEEQNIRMIDFKMTDIEYCVSFFVNVLPHSG